MYRETIYVNQSCLFARAKHLLQGSLLSSADNELVRALDLNPRSSVLAVEALDRGLPLVWAAVALVLVGAHSSSPQLGTLDVIGELLTLFSGPLIGAALEQG